MADIAKRLPQNAAGRYYVDGGCIDCALCPEVAPAVFRSDPEAGVGYVYAQPRTAGQEQLLKEAMNLCPVNAIGEDDDGVQATRS